MSEQQGSFPLIEKSLVPLEDRLDEDRPQKGHTRPVKLFHLPEGDGAIREGDEVTIEGGEHIREAIREIIEMGDSEFAFERIPIDEMKERLQLYKFEPRMGIRNAHRLVAAASMVRPRLKAAWEEGYVPIVAGGDHSVALMSIPEAATRFPDPEDPQFSELRVINIDRHADVLSAQDIKAFMQTLKLLEEMKTNPDIFVLTETRDTLDTAHEILQRLNKEPEQLRFSDKIDGLKSALTIFESYESGAADGFLNSKSLAELQAALELLLGVVGGVGNAHGRWGSTVQGKGPTDLMPAMQGKRFTKSENHMTVGTGQNDPEEIDFIRDTLMPTWSLKRFRADRMGFYKELRKLLTIEKDGKAYKAPVWIEIDPDVLKDTEGGQGTAMVSKTGMTAEELEEILAFIAVEGNVIGIGIAEVAPARDPEGKTAEVVSRAIFRALGKGDPDYYGYNERKAHKVTSEQGAPSADVGVEEHVEAESGGLVGAVARARNSSRRKLLGWAGGIAAGIGGLIVGHQLTKPTDVSLSQSDKQAESVSGEQFLQESRDRMYRFVKNDVRQQIAAYGTAQGSHREHQEYVALLRKVWDAESLAPGKGDRSDVFQYLLSELVDALGHQKGSEVYQRLMSQV